MKRLPKRKHYSSIASPSTTHVVHHTDGVANAKFILIGLAAIVVCFSVCKLVIANHFATKGSDLAQLMTEKDQLTQENDVLATKLATITSLSYVRNQAKAEGFVDASQVVFLQTQDTQPVAYNTQLNNAE